MSTLDTAIDQLVLTRAHTDYCARAACGQTPGGDAVMLTHTNVHVPHFAATFTYCSEGCADLIVAHWRATNQQAGISLEYQDRRTPAT